MTQTTYPALSPQASAQEIINFIKEITRLREDEDIGDFTNLINVFVSGRSTARVPSSNSDVLATDEVGDIVNDATFEYKLLKIGDASKWDRRTLDVSW